MNAAAVYVVDDDPSIRDATALFLGLHGIPTRLFESGESFLAVAGPEAVGCLLLDLKMAGIGGIEVQKELVRRGSLLRVVVMTAHGDVPTTRDALIGGAIDFLEKPVEHARLLETVRRAMASSIDAGQRVTEKADWQQRVARLTSRELEIMRLLVKGLQNREIASTLGISARTVEVHKARILDKLGLERPADLIRLGLAHSG